MTSTPIAKLLTDRQAALAVSQKEAAGRCGVSGSTFGRWARGEIVPDPDKYRAIAEFLDVPISVVVNAIGGSTATTTDPVAELISVYRGLRQAADHLEERMATMDAGELRLASHTFSEVQKTVTELGEILSDFGDGIIDTLASEAN